jgi:uncharacterized protein YjiS (DUF1127 family)
MAHAISNDAPFSDYADHISTGKAGSLFARLVQAIAQHRQYLAMVEELSALPDRDLADIGLSRLNIRDLAHDAVHGS